MELIEIEKYLDSPTTSCDSTSSVNDCYFLIPEAMRQYFDESANDGFIDVMTNKSYKFPITRGREFRLTQFNSYINDKNITMGDKIIIHTLINNDKNLSFYIDTAHTYFFKKISSENNLYKYYGPENFEDNFSTNSIVNFPLENEKTLKIEKKDNNYIIDGISKQKFILEKHNEVNRIIDLKSANSLIIDKITMKNEEDIKYLFGKYINDLDIQTKKVEKRIAYLDKILPNRINKDNPTSIFNIKQINQLEVIRDTLSSNGENHEWDATYGREVLQTINYYIKFLKTISNEGISHTLEIKESLNQHYINLTTHEEVDFPYLNILFKGVPGTGKSNIIDKIIHGALKLVDSDYQNNILRVNIHSASSNADLMQGIGITTEDSQVAYKEKQGLIFEHIRKACFSPKQPFVLILEEIQENSLNELIGDLIYLIEPSKRMEIDKLTEGLQDKQKITYLGNDSLVEQYIEIASQKDDTNVHTVKIPYLVETSTEYRELILPSNLYVFCTSNYRDDKKVIEDNLLRRFHVIELYPQYDTAYSDESDNISEFLKILNLKILDEFKDEIHPDRFLVGHANWLKIKEGDKKAFYMALLKVLIDFKEIREIESKFLHTVFEKTLNDIGDSWVKEPFQNILDNSFKKPASYQMLIKFLQDEVYMDDILTFEKND